MAIDFKTKKPTSFITKKRIIEIVGKANTLVESEKVAIGKNIVSSILDGKLGFATRIVGTPDELKILISTDIYASSLFVLLAYDKEKVIMLTKSSVHYTIMDFESKSLVGHSFVDDDIEDSNIISNLNENAHSIIFNMMEKVNELFDEKINEKVDILPEGKNTPIEGDDHESHS